MKTIVISLMISILSITAVQAHPGIGIVMDSHGNVYYTDLSHVWRISTNGERTIAVKDVHTHELYIDDQDNLYGEHEWYKGEATDTWANYVWCLSSTGVLERIVPEVEGFLDNTTLVRDPVGNSYWVKKSGASQIINRQTTSGNSAPLTPHQFKDIRWMYFSPAHTTLYVVDILTLYQVSLTGDVKIIANSLKDTEKSFDGVADRHYVYGITTDNNNNVYVATFGAQTVKKIDPAGNITTTYKSEEGWSPSGVLMGSNKSMWIMEFSTKNKTRVVHIDSKGNTIVYGRKK